MANSERNVIFLRCSQDEYNDLKASNQINENVIYYITDGGVIYQGKQVYGSKFMQTYNWDIVTKNTFMYNKNTGEIRYYYSDNDFVTINESSTERKNETQNIVNNSLSWIEMSKK